MAQSVGTNRPTPRSSSNSECHGRGERASKRIVVRVRTRICSEAVSSGVDVAVKQTLRGVARAGETRKENDGKIAKWGGVEFMQTLGGCATTLLGLRDEHRTPVILFPLHIRHQTLRHRTAAVVQRSTRACQMLEVFPIGAWPRIETTPTSATPITMVPPLSRCYVHERTSTACNEKQRHS